MVDVGYCCWAHPRRSTSCEWYDTLPQCASQTPFDQPHGPTRLTTAMPAERAPTTFSNIRNFRGRKEIQ